MGQCARLRLKGPQPHLSLSLSLFTSHNIIQTNILHSSHTKHTKTHQPLLCNSYNKESQDAYHVQCWYCLTVAAYPLVHANQDSRQITLKQGASPEQIDKYTPPALVIHTPTS